MTPKQKRLRGKQEQPEAEAGVPTLLDEQFDEPSEADREFVRWRFPEREDG